MDSVRDDILQSLEDIETVTMESEMGVIYAMSDSYQKSLAILENYSGEDLDSFSIFQESFIQEAEGESTFRKMDKNGKKENIIISILKFIPRLFMMIVKKLKTFINGSAKPRIRELANKLKKQTSEALGKADELINMTVEDAEPDSPDEKNIINKCKPYIEKLKKTGNIAASKTKSVIKDKNNILIAAGSGAALGGAIATKKMRGASLIVIGGLALTTVGITKKIKKVKDERNTMINLGSLDATDKIMNVYIQELTPMRDIVKNISYESMKDDLEKLCAVINRFTSIIDDKRDSILSTFTTEDVKLIDHIDDIIERVEKMDKTADKLMKVYDDISEGMSQLIKSADDIDIVEGNAARISMDVVSMHIGTTADLIEACNCYMSYIVGTFESLNYACEEVNAIADKWQKKA